MENESVNLKSDRLFPSHFLLLGLIFTIVGLLLILFSPYLAPLFLLLGGMILTGYRGVEFDRIQKKYREYNSFLFMKFGDWENYDKPEKIFINSVNVSQKIYTMVTTGTIIRNVEYNAYMELGNGEKIYLISKKDKNRLYKKLSRIADFFQLEVIDYSK